MNLLSCWTRMNLTYSINLCVRRWRARFICFVNVVRSHLWHISHWNEWCFSSYVVCGRAEAQRTTVSFCLLSISFLMTQLPSSMDRMKIRNYRRTNARTQHKHTLSPRSVLRRKAEHFAGQAIRRCLQYWMPDGARVSECTTTAHGNFVCKSSHLIQIKSKLMRLFAFEPLFCLHNECAEFTSYIHNKHTNADSRTEYSVRNSQIRI